MSKIVNGFLGLTVGALALGVVHLEYARSGQLPAALPQSDAALRVLHDIDRDGKSGRLALREGIETTTMFVYPVTAPATLIAARITRKPAASTKKPPAESKSTPESRVACEPLMSVLAAAAETSQPGRCLV